MLKALFRGKKEEEMSPKHVKAILPLIKQGIALVKKAAEIKIKLVELNARLLPWADELRELTKLQTATFKSEIGTAVVKFSESLAWDEKDMPRIKRAAGPLFSTLFHEIPQFSLNMDAIPEIKRKLGADFEKLVILTPTYKHTPALKDILCDGDSQVGKELREYIRIEPGKPVFGYEEIVKAAESVPSAPLRERKSKGAA
jgi:hypothetical protein